MKGMFYCFLKEVYDRNFKTKRSWFSNKYWLFYECELHISFSLFNFPGLNSLLQKVTTTIKNWNSIKTVFIKGIFTKVSFKYFIIVCIVRITSPELPPMEKDYTDFHFSFTIPLNRFSLKGQFTMVSFKYFIKKYVFYLSQ